MRIQCCRHIVADTNVSPFGHAHNICCRRDTKFVSETQKMFLIFVRNILCPQQMFPGLRSMDTKQIFCVPHVCQPKKQYEQQCVRFNVSSFATTLHYRHPCLKREEGKEGCQRICRKCFTMRGREGTEPGACVNQKFN